MNEEIPVIRRRTRRSRKKIEDTAKQVRIAATSNLPSLPLNSTGIVRLSIVVN